MTNPDTDHTEYAEALLDSLAYHLFKQNSKGDQETYDKVYSEKVETIRKALRLADALEREPIEHWKFTEGDRVRKIKGSSWQGTVCGFYNSSLTPRGYCVESEREPGSVQVYPEAALEMIGGNND